MFLEDEICCICKSENDGELASCDFCINLVCVNADDTEICYKTDENGNIVCVDCQKAKTSIMNHDLIKKDEEKISLAGGLTKDVLSLSVTRNSLLSSLTSITTRVTLKNNKLVLQKGDIINLLVDPEGNYVVSITRLNGERYPWFGGNLEISWKKVKTGQVTLQNENDLFLYQGDTVSLIVDLKGHFILTVLKKKTNDGKINLVKLIEGLLK